MLIYNVLLHLFVGVEVGEGLALDLAAEEGVEEEVDGGGGEELLGEDGGGMGEPVPLWEEGGGEDGEVMGGCHGGEGEGDVGGEVPEHVPDATGGVAGGYLHGGYAAYGGGCDLSPEEYADAEGDVGAGGEGKAADGGDDGSDGYTVAEGFADDEHARLAEGEYVVVEHHRQDGEYAAQQQYLEEDDGGVPLGAEEEVEDGGRHYGEQSEGGEGQVGGAAVHLGGGSAKFRGVVLYLREGGQECLYE